MCQTKILLQFSLENSALSHVDDRMGLWEYAKEKSLDGLQNRIPELQGSEKLQQTDNQPNKKTNEPCVSLQYSTSALGQLLDYWGVLSNTRQPNPIKQQSFFSV